MNSETKKLDKEYLFKRINNMYMTEKIKERRLANLSYENMQKILLYKDIHKGERCFIIGGSPSLKLLDLSKLNNEYTFCVNRGYKLKEQGLNHSTYYVLSDKNLVETDKVMDDFPSDFCKKFFVDVILDFPDKLYDTTYFSSVILNKQKFIADLTKDLTLGYTVIYFALQIAYYMGFSPIYLIGVDLDFKNISGHAYKELETEKQRQIDVSICSERFMKNAIKNAVQYITEHKREIYNASPKKTLEFMENADYENLF